MGAISPQQQGNTIAALLQRPDIAEQIGLALPKHLTPERLLRIAVTEVRRNPGLGKCSPESLLGAVFQCAQLGLEPGGSLGHAYLVPYGTNVQFILGYRGMIDLARRSGQIKSLEAHLVYEGDDFECELGLSSDLKHRPDWSNPNRTDDSKITFAYAVAHLADGGREFEVISRAEIEATKKRSRGQKSGPWQTDFGAMARKTVVRRLFKWLPLSVEIQQAVVNDEAPETSRRQETPIDHLLEPSNDDAQPSLPPATAAILVSSQQLESLERASKMRLNETGAAAFLATFEIESLSAMPAESFDVAMTMLTDIDAVGKLNGAGDES